MRIMTFLVAALFTSLVAAPTVANAVPGQWVARGGYLAKPSCDKARDNVIAAGYPANWVKCKWEAPYFMLYSWQK